MNIKSIFATLLLMLSGAVSFAQQTAQGDSPENGKPKLAVVELSTVYMRVSPDYESSLETQELMGTVVEIVGSSGYWREIVSPQPYKAWCTDKGIVPMSEQEIQDYEKAPKLMFTGLYGHIYSSKSTCSQTICDLVGGDILRQGGDVSHKWIEVVTPSGKKGYVQKELLKEFSGFRSLRWSKNRDELSEYQSFISDKDKERIIGSAMQLLGVPYLWGGMSPKGVDCSGLVRWACLMNGILLPRNASQQVFCGKDIPVDADPAYWDEDARGNQAAFKEEMQRRISKLKRGDLLFFGTPATAEKGRRITHVGIYTGNGKMIHSSHLVRVNSLVPDEADYYENAHRLLAAVRL